MSKWSEGAEGFICPYCLVSFNSSNKLQAHFIDFHSEECSDAAIVLELEDEQQSDLFEDKLGHIWKFASLPKPRSCEACNIIIWSSSYTCQTCQMVIHSEDKCINQVTKVCVDERTESSSPSQQVIRADAPPPPKGIGDLVKRHVAKGRNRFTDGGFDLDLSYITERIIAMSFPSSGLEVAYRNNLKDVAKMLKTRHQENYMIFNLSERSYDISRFNNQVLDFGWPDHLAPSLERLSIVCKSMKSWLDSDPQHVVVVHCKGGKGRTGCVIAAFMHYSRICQTASDALDYFAMKRFYDDKLQGVTQPSQRRYVHYFEDLLNGKFKLDAPPIKLLYIIIHGIPNFDGKGGCRPFIKIYQNMELIYTSGLYVCTSDKDRVKISLYGGLKLEGEILIKCFHKRSHTGVDSIFRCQFHHSVISDCRIVWTKQDLDDSFKDKRFNDDIKVELLFEPTASHPSHFTSEEVDIRHSLLADRHSMIFDAGIDKRNSYASFAGGYDNGVPSGAKIPALINFEDMPAVTEKDRSSTSGSDKMDPSLIQRIAADNGGDLYTVVNKTPTTSRDNSRNPSPELRQPAKPIPRKLINDIELSTSIPKYSHLVHSSNKAMPPARPLIPPIGMYSQINKGQIHGPVDQLPRDGHRYDDVSGKRLVLAPVPPSDGPNEDVWMRVKWQTLQQDTKRENSLSSSQRSSSQTALDQLQYQDVYTNLSELASEGPFIAQQRRHSFTEGDSIIITSPTNHHSIIPIGAIEGAMVAPSNGNAPQFDDADYYSIPDEEDSEHRIKDIEDSQLYVIPPDAKEALYGNVPNPGEDYVNFDAEQLPHDYWNEAELREQLRNNSHAPARQEIKPATVIHQKVQPTGLKDILMENLRIKKPTTKTVIQSSAVTYQERKHAMPMFHLVSSNERALQVGRGDYMEFDMDSWGARKSRENQQKSHDNPQRSHDYQQRSRDNPQRSHDYQQRSHDNPHRSHDYQQRSHDNPQRSHDKQNLDKPHPKPPPITKRTPSPLPDPPISSRPHPLVKASSKDEGSPKPSKKPLGRGEPPPKPPYPPGMKHKPLNSTKSVPAVDDIIPAVDYSDVKGPSKKVSHSSSALLTGKDKPPPPPKPAPYQPSDKGKSHALNQVKDLMPLWYKPTITRDEACNIVKKMEAGSFIVRDSQTVSGGYALTINVSEDLIRQRRKFTDSKSDIEVTADMRVTHFLIQPDPEGVKLQGWNEPAFRALPDFIAKHTMDKLCLPCILKLPKKDSPRAKKISADNQLLSAAACDLVLLGNIEVPHPVGDSVISEAVKQLKALDLPTSSIVNFKASVSGITLTDKSNGILNKRNYPLQSITYCGLDNTDTRWDLSHLGSIRNKPCFGVIHKMSDAPGHICLLFAELDAHQPISNVVAYIKRLINSSKHN